MTLSKYWLVASRVTMYKFSPGESREFWEWLYRRVVDTTSSDYARPIFIMYLLADALDKGEFVRAADVYMRFVSIVEKHSNPDLMVKVNSALMAAQNREKLTGSRVSR